jgi:hypothetical protein
MGMRSLCIGAPFARGTEMGRVVVAGAREYDEAMLNYRM